MLTVQVNDAAFQADLRALYVRLGDLTPLMDNIGMALESQISGRFETKTDPKGQRWALWADSTVANYPKDGNRQLLDRYGDMLRSLTHKPDSSSVTVGFGTPYAVFHEFGTDKMPRRGLLFADPVAGTLGIDDELEVLDIIQLWISRD